ncbi:MAG TPA: aminotransferase class I/II-fold pyridoxal phosphate-dependent enzyme [Acetobacteraceae bacterium]|jgi:glycine hydroxymethyltransferase|nr:aminotransferase class I/II-fold pyridoxal phosphate-dependent enzyme [Acetobacteraceae bacterium]
MLGKRDWVPPASEQLTRAIAARVAASGADTIEAEIAALIAESRAIHEYHCINLNPATNVMNPAAEAVLAQGLGTRASLGYPGDKYEMGLEAIEKIEVIAAELAAETFGARFVEIRVPSGAIANLYAFMAIAKPGDTMIAPPPEIGGHVTHHRAGAAGCYGIVTVPAPIDPARYTVEIGALRAAALRVRPKLITIGGSLNLFPHPLGEIRAIADEIGAVVLFDAAHLSGMIAGGAWQRPLEEGAHIMTMSTYKSLGGPPSGLILTNEPELARRIEAIAYPGLTANFDVAKSASLAITLLDWKRHGPSYAAAMAETAHALATSLAARGLPVFAAAHGMTSSHQFALEAAGWGGGQQAAKILRRANILACGIGLPISPVAGDVNGLRLGTPEIVRWGMGPAEMPELAGYVARALENPADAGGVASDVTAFRRRFSSLRFVG